ncbi:MAG TPA: ABC transporter substrate-binding protein [Hyphomicrobiaceae bacterium]|nr:ABC transporter substrate-binding protein [Hyphomicrobiaceae bacterium]
MIDRRALVCGSALLVAAGALPLIPRAAAGSLRVGSVKYGSLNWVLEIIRSEGLDRQAGLEFEVIDVASNQAGPVALLSGGADVIVSDWTWAMRQRALGEKLKFSPYSSALGSIVVPKDSAIKSLADLEGKKLGVAGSAIDKSWLLLRAYSRKTLGRDIAEVADTSFGAAPLLTEEIRSGRIDAVLNFWTYAARLSGSGFSPLLSMSEVMRALGIDPVPSLVGFVWREDYEATNGPAIKALLGAVEAANELLARSDAAWERLRPLVKPASDAEFKAIIASYRAGIPEPWGEGEMRSAEKLMKLLVEVGDEELVGPGTRFDARLFHHAAG